MHFLLAHHRLPSFFFGTLIILSLIVSFFLVKDVQQYRHYHHEVSRLTVNSVANELREIFTQQQQRAELLVLAYEDIFNDWIEEPYNSQKRFRLNEVLKKHFPEHYSFTLATQSGEAIWDDMGETIGELCMLELKKYANQSSPAQSPVSYIHPGPQQYHYDLFVTIKSPSGQKTLLVGFKPSYLATILKQRQSPYHHLMLVRKDANDLIDITADGSRDVMTRSQHYTAAEQQLIVQGLFGQSEVHKTHWTLVDMIDPNILSEKQQQLVQMLAALWILTLLLGWIKWRLLRHHHEAVKTRELALIEMNQTLEERVCQRTHMLEQQQVRLKLAANVFEKTSEGILITDEQNRIVDVNDALIAITGYQRHELLGQNPRIFKSHYNTHDFYQQMWHSLTEQGHWHGELEDFTSKGKIISMRCAISVIKNDQNVVTHYIAIYTDITEFKKTREALQAMAYHDRLTGLPNRILLFDRLKQSLAMNQRQRTLLAVCYLDLDGFKPVNDTLGHEVGDLLLKEVAQRLQQALRSSDTAARLGGDEFVLLMNSLENKQECERALDRIMANLHAPFQLGDHNIKISASIGVSFYPEHGIDAESLLRVADQTMYRVKHHQKNGYLFADDAKVIKATDIPA